MSDEDARWEQISCTEREALIDEHGRSHNGFSEESGVCVLAGRTNMGGPSPIMYTVWGFREGEVPLLKDVRYPSVDGEYRDRKPCEHYRNVGQTGS